MKIGIVTPTVGGEQLRECHTSVRESVPQGLEWIHVIVGDGVQLAPMNSDVHEQSTKYRAADAGATPRAIGSAYAIGQGCDALFFLDDDCTFEPTHISNALQLAQQGALVVASRRIMVSAVTGEPMYIDAESDGVEFADTNTIALFGMAAQFGTTWNWFRQPSGADRVFWERLQHSFRGMMACTEQPTVRYRASWAASYNPTGEDGMPIWQPPELAKFPEVRPDGTRIARIARPSWNAVARRWVPEVAA